MADTEDESNMTAGAAEGQSDGGAAGHSEAVAPHAGGRVVSLGGLGERDGSGGHPVELCAQELTGSPGIAEYLHGGREAAVEGESCQVVGSFTSAEGILHEGNIITTSFVEAPGGESVADFAAVAGELVDGMNPATSTIIYVQPDGSFVEGTGLTAEEQRQLVEQLAKQQLVEVTENEAARIFETRPQHPPPAAPAHFIHHSTTLAPEELQQVIEQVAKAQQSAGAAVEQHGVVSLVQAQGAGSEAQVSLDAGCLFPAGAQPLAVVQNASQQLQHVAKQVALQQNRAQNGTRLIQKKLETIRIQVKNLSAPEPPERPMPPLAMFQQRSVSAVSQSTTRVSVSPALSIGSPQIIRIQPFPGTGGPQQSQQQQQFFLHSGSGEPPIQLLVQRRVPTAEGASTAPRRLPAKPSLNGRPGKGGGVAVVSGAPGSGSVSGALDRKERQKEKEREKKPQKIKTRSGRISRPPKYKVKDYKFIKREDLADGHPSDSDDYSEISVEEEEEEEDRVAGGPGERGGDTGAINFNLNPKAFKCETCEKAYIGRGGLSRHYRLNPAHGEKGPGSGGPVNQEVRGPAVGSGAVLSAGGTTTVTAPQTDGRAALTPVTAPQTADSERPKAGPGVTAETVIATATESAPLSGPEDTKVDSAVPPAPSVPALPTCAGPGRPRGPGRPKGPGRPGRPKLSGRPARRAKPGRPPKYLGGVTTEQQIQRRRARLKEILQQCDNEELMEMALPRLAKVMTVWEFLLMKVEKGRPSRPHFADVYREFEQLHGQVKKMAQDHFGSAHGVGPNAALEIRDLQVSRSLGIEELVKRSRAVQGVCKENHLPAGKRPLTDSECGGGSSQPPAKSLRLEDSSGATNGIYISQNGLQGVSGEEPSTAGSDRPGHEQLRPEAAVAEAAALGDKLLQTGGGFAALEPGGDPSGVLLYQPLEVEELQEVTEPGEAGGAGPVMFTSLDADFSPEELVQGQLSGGGCETTVVTPAGGGEEAQLGPDGEEEAGADGETEGGALLEEISQGERGGAEPSEVLNDSDIADQMQQLENALSRDVVPLDHSYRTHVAGPGEAPQHEGVFVAGGTETEEDSHAAQSELQVMELTDLAQDGGMETNGSLQHHIAVGGTVEFQLSEANQELLSQGHEQIFIQTAEGLIMHHGAGGLASDRIVIVTDANGTTMHIRAPEGVPLETVEALLGIDTEGQSGGILVSETGP